MKVSKGADNLNLSLISVSVCYDSSFTFEYSFSGGNKSNTKLKQICVSKKKYVPSQPSMATDVSVIF